MGSFQSAGVLPPIPPLPVALGLYHDSLAPVQTNIIMDYSYRWKSEPRVFTTDRMVPVIQCSGEGTWPKKRIVLDSQGLYLVRLRSGAFHDYGEGPEPQKQEMFHVRSGPMFSNATLLDFTDVFSGKRITLSVTDSHAYTEVDGEKCRVYDVRLDGGGGKGTLIARILRPGRTSSRYVLTVAPGADMALLSSMCLVLDERIKRVRRNARLAAAGRYDNAGGGGGC